MQSKTSCSKFSLFRRCLRRYWPVTFAVLLVLLLWMVFPLASHLSSCRQYEHMAAPALRRLATETVFANIQWMPLFAGLFGLAAAMAAFEHTYSTRLTGLFASLPVKREKLFAQHWLAGLWMLLSAGIVTALALLAVEAVYGAMDPMSAFSWLGAYAMESLTFYGIAVFCVMLTGHVLVIPALYALVNFGASALNLMISGLVQSYAYGVINGTECFGWMHTLSPFVRLVTEVHANDGDVVSLEGWGWIVGYCVMGMILTGLALLLFKKRHNERAQETTAFAVLRPLLKYIVTIFFALGFPFVVLFFLGSNPLFGTGVANAQFFALHLALTLIGAVIGYFLSEMIIHKSIRVSTGKGWVKALLVGALCCGVIGLFRFDAFGIARRVPAAETVQTIELYVQDQEYHVSTPEGIEAIEDLHREIIARQSETERQFDTADYSTYLSLTYMLQDGSVLQRGYAIPEGALLDLAEDTLNTPAVQSGLKELNPPVPVDNAHLTEGYISYLAENADYESDWNLTTAEALALYEEAIRPDIEAGHYGKADLHYNEAEYNRTHYGVRICLTLKIDDRSGVSLTYEPTPETTFTNAWLEAHGIELVPLADRAGG